MPEQNFVDDPNSISWFEVSCRSASRLVSRLPLAGDMVDIVCDRVKARDDYMQMHPLLMENVQQKEPNNATVLYFCQQLILTAQFGACRQNFRRHFIDGKNKGQLVCPQIPLINKLPKDPNDIMFGYWKAQF